MFGAGSVIGLKGWPRLMAGQLTFPEGRGECPFNTNQIAALILPRE